jgi:hypothetical protein
LCFAFFQVIKQAKTLFEGTNEFDRVLLADAKAYLQNGNIDDSLGFVSLLHFLVISVAFVAKQRQTRQKSKIL